HAFMGLSPGLDFESAPRQFDRVPRIGDAKEPRRVREHARLIRMRCDCLAPRLLDLFVASSIDYRSLRQYEHVRLGPVAEANIDVDVKIAENGEVLFKSPGVFLGYYKDPEKTAETKTPDGWVHIGDAGFFDPKTGHLKIIDRAKDVGRLANGALFAPKYIENKLKFFPNIKEAVAFGDKRASVTCMLNIDRASIGAWAER
ncbi:hypothetical protein B4Q13_21255, partial [Lacticaseibacillus rhamnosus]